MFLLTSLVMLIIYGIVQLYAAFGAGCRSWIKKSTSEDVFKWAQEHENEWIDGTDIIVRENGKLMYYPRGYNRFDSYEVHYGWDDNHFQYGIVYAGSVVFNYEQVQYARHILATNPHRVQYMNGKPLLNLGQKRGLISDIYKVVGEEKYYCHGKEVWLVNKGSCVCKFSNEKIYDPKRKEI